MTSTGSDCFGATLEAFSALSWFLLQVLASYQKSQQWQHALNVLRFLQNADAINYGAALHACTKSSSWMAASTLVVGMKQLTMEANTILANTLIDGLARLSFWEQPMEQLMAMRHQNLRYNRASFGPAFSAFSSSSPSSSSSSPSSSWQHVLAMLGLARRLRLQPDVVTSGAALHALKNLASWRTPLDFLHCMTTAATLPNTVCLTSAAGSCQDWQNALALSTSRGRPARARQLSKVLIFFFFFGGGGGVLLHQFSEAGGCPGGFSYSTAKDAESS